jgi:hypothetical protein
LETPIDWLLGIREAYDNSTSNQIVVISSWYHRAKKNEMISGSIDYREYSKITSALTSIINTLKEINIHKYTTGEKIIFERNLKVKLLAMPDLPVIVQRFEKMVRFNTESPLVLRLIFNQRNINISFRCSKNITVSSLKRKVMSYFRFDQFIEHSSQISINWKIFHFEKLLEDESLTLKQYEIDEEDWIVLRMEILFKIDDAWGGGYGGGGGGFGNIILDMPPI